MSSNKLQEDICASDHSSKEGVRIEMIRQLLSSLLAGNRVLGFRINMRKSAKIFDIIGYGVQQLKGYTATGAFQCNQQQEQGGQ